MKNVTPIRVEKLKNTSLRITLPDLRHFIIYPQLLTHQYSRSGVLIKVRWSDGQTLQSDESYAAHGFQKKISKKILTELKCHLHGRRVGLSYQ